MNARVTMRRYSSQYREARGHFQRGKRSVRAVMVGNASENRSRHTPDASRCSEHDSRSNASVIRQKLLSQHDHHAEGRNERYGKRREYDHRQNRLLDLQKR